MNTNDIKAILRRNRLTHSIYRKLKNTIVIPLRFTSFGIFNLRKFPLKDLFNPKKTSLFKIVWPYTKNGYSRLTNVYDLAIEIERNKIPGAFVECGSWKGGCCAVMGAIANRFGSNRKTWYLDSFEGMPEPSQFDGEGTEEIEGDVLKASVSDVEELIFDKLHLPRENNIIAKGWFEEVLPKIKKDIGNIAIFRLDADWYEPTKLVLSELYDQVMSGGYVIFDDYGRWVGCRKAVDEFVRDRKLDVEFKFIGGKSPTRSPMYFKKR